MRERGPLPAPPTSRSYASIVRANTFTIPNAILFVFGVLTVTFDSWREALFLGILVSNIVIGCFQDVGNVSSYDPAILRPEPARRHGRRSQANPARLRR